MEIEIGRGKKARRAYGFDDIAIVPSRRTRDAEDVDIAWRLGPHLLELPLLASAMDGVVSPATAIELGQLGGLGVLNLEGIWTRYEDADTQLQRIASFSPAEATHEMQQIYKEPIKRELVVQRIKEIKEAGVLAAASLTPQRVREYWQDALDAGLDVLVIQGTVVSAEHVSTVVEPLNLKEFIASMPVPVIVGGCASYQAALHLMRTGAAGVLVGVGPGRGVHHARRARGGSAAGDGDRRRGRRQGAAPARDRAVRERDRRRRHADGRRHLQGHRLRRRRGHDRFAAGPRQRGPRPRLPLGDGDLPSQPAPRSPRADHAGGAAGADRRRPGDRERRDAQPDGRAATSMATTGYDNIQAFQKAEIMFAPALQTEGKKLQREQAIGMSR